MSSSLIAGSRPLNKTSVGPGPATYTGHWISIVLPDCVLDCRQDPRSLPMGARCGVVQVPRALEHSLATAERLRMDGVVGGPGGMSRGD